MAFMRNVGAWYVLKIEVHPGHWTEMLPPRRWDQVLRLSGTMRRDRPDAGLRVERW